MNEGSNLFHRSHLIEEGKGIWLTAVRREMIFLTCWRDVMAKEQWKDATDALGSVLELLEHHEVLQLLHSFSPWRVRRVREVWPRFAAEVLN